MSFSEKIFIISLVLFSIWAILRGPYYKKRRQAKDAMLEKIKQFSGESNFRIDERINILPDSDKILLFDFQISKMALCDYSNSDVDVFSFDDLCFVTLVEECDRFQKELVTKLGLDIKVKIYKDVTVHHISFILRPTMKDTNEYNSALARVTTAKGIIMPIIQKENERKRSEKAWADLREEKSVVASHNNVPALNPTPPNYIVDNLDEAPDYDDDCEISSTDLTNGLISPTGKLFIDVPYSEKDTAKKLGARWDPTNKKWYATKRDDYIKFINWFMYDYEEQIIALDHIYLVTSERTCYNCQESTPVIAFGIENRMVIRDDGYDPQTYSCSFSNTASINIMHDLDKSLPERFKNYLDEKFIYKMGYSQINGYHLANHCQYCGFIQGNNYLHDEFGGPFHLDCIETIQNLTFEKISLEADWPISASICFSSGDEHIRKHATFKDCDFAFTDNDIAEVEVNRAPNTI